MPTTASYYRQDAVITCRPYGVDVDENDWLWEGVAGSRLVAHNLTTAEFKTVNVPQMLGTQVYTIFCWQGKLLLVMGNLPSYLIFDPATNQCQTKALPGENPITWYGARLPNNRVMLFDRGNSQGLIFDHIDAEPRIIKFNHAGDLGFGALEDDGLVYIFLGSPTQLVRFDPTTEKFSEPTPIPYPDAAISGRCSHEGILYCADSSAGRVLRLDLKSQSWLPPLAAPDHGKIYGFIGGVFKANNKAHFCLSTYAHKSRLDKETGKVIVPPGGYVGVDGQKIRFMERMLTLDLDTHAWDYLIAPTQPDGVPLLCYSWSDGKRFAVTGCVQPFAQPGKIMQESGPWAVLQNPPASPLPGYTEFDFATDKFSIRNQRANQYTNDRSLYLPDEKWSPPIQNMRGRATAYDPGTDHQLLQRAKATDSKTYWSMVLGAVLPKGETDPALKFKAILTHVSKYIYYNPIQSPTTSNPIAVHQAREGRCGHAAAIVRAMCENAGLQTRLTPLQNHTVAEAYYDNDWHMGDALFFGASQPNKDGRIFSIQEMKATPHVADGYPQWCFVYPPELLTSQDGYQVLGYVFGLWGSEPYYSYYLGAAKEHPPTRPAPMPAQRLNDSKLRLNWGRSIKHEDPDALIEYDVKAFSDRAGTDMVFHAVTRETSVTFEPPKPNWMYFMHVKAMDNQREKNPQTWYPATVWNFVLMPKDQYGWYGVL